MKPAAFVDRHIDTEPAPDWSDTVPVCFRSEAFAEDLQVAPPKGAPSASNGSPTPPRLAPRRPRPWATWGATLALLGRRPAATP
jgi:hypothetical protein